MIGHEGRDLELLLGERRAEDAAHRHRVEAAGEAVEEAADRVDVQRRDRVAVDEVAAPGEQGAREHGVAQVGGPARERREVARRGGAEADDRDAAQVAAAHDRVGGVGGAEHHPGDLRPQVADLGEHGGEGGADAPGDVEGGGLLRPGDHGAVAVEHDGVGVRAADVDAHGQVAAAHSTTSAFAKGT